MTERQTLTYLQRSFRKAKIQPQTKFGQNFLIDLNLVELIANTAQLTRRDVVLEVGTGTGSLTAMLAERAGHVVTVEIDRHLARLAREEFSQVPNVTLLELDALRSKSQFDARIPETLREQIAQIPGGRLKLVANLPYNVATPILSNLLYMDPWPARMVATIQRELAERVCAQPRTKDYSALSVWVQSQCRAQIVRLMPPSVFWPRPKVDSAILDIQPQVVLRDRIGNREFFHELVRRIFQHRRKFLRSALVSAMKGKLDKAQVDDLMLSLDLGPTTRAEELTPQQLIELSDNISDRFR
jgi:16S rRNA (adenine1518-N6/adenine1519-N6)-dimethyltransferase